MHDRPLFSVRETLSNKGKPGDIFRRCLVQAKQFIDSHSVAEVLDYAFTREENRRVVRESVRGFLHVGFLSPYRELTIHDMKDLSKDVGFFSGFSTVTSAVVSRELGYLEGRGDTPTAIFTAKSGQIHEDCSYVEVFIPNKEEQLIRKWIGNEVATHVGLILEQLPAFADIQKAFREEGFQVAPFMNGKQIDSPDKAASVIYYEKPHGDGNRKFRIEIFSPYRIS